MILTEDSMLILRIARYYYIDQYTQQEIAKMVNLHRSQVSRLLKLARELGYVNIDVSLPAKQDNLAQNIQKELGLERVFIAPEQNPLLENNNESLYLFASSFLEKELANGGKIGIGWGKTLYNIALNLSNINTINPISFYSLTGFSGTNYAYLQINSITDRFAHFFNGKAFYNNFTCYLKLDALNTLEKQRLNELKNNWSEINTVIMSLGGGIQSDKPYMEELPNETDFHVLLNSTKGDILGHFLLENNEQFKLPMGYISTSMELQSLKKVPNIICIAAGIEKVHTIIRAAKQGYIKTLITDEATGKLILASLL